MTKNMFGSESVPCYLDRAQARGQKETQKKHNEKSNSVASKTWGATDNSKFGFNWLYNIYSIINKKLDTLHNSEWGQRKTVVARSDCERSEAGATKQSPCINQ